MCNECIQKIKLILDLQLKNAKLQHALDQISILSRVPEIASTNIKTDTTLPNDHFSHPYFYINNFKKD